MFTYLSIFFLVLIYEERYIPVIYAYLERGLEERVLKTEGYLEVRHDEASCV